MGLYVAKEVSQAVHCNGSEAIYTKGQWSYMNLLGIFLFVQGAAGLPLPEATFLLWPARSPRAQ